MAKFMFIDANNIGYASQYTTKLHVAGREVQAIFQFMKTMRSLMAAHRGYTPLIMWDGKAQHRFDLYPEYKGNRNQNPDQIEAKAKYEEQRPEIKRGLTLLGVRQLTVSNLEADDLAGYLSKKTTDDGNEVLLISGDKDWIQLVNDKCVWHDPKLDQTVTSDNFAEKTGFVGPAQYVEGKALMGDSSDNIQGVGGIGEKGAIDFLMEHGSVREFLGKAKRNELDEKIPSSHQRFLDNKPFVYRKKEYQPMAKSFVRNVKLMDLRNVAKPCPDLTESISARLDEEKFKDFAAELAFNSILKTFDVWVTPFRRTI